MNEPVIISAARTAVGKFGGSLKGVTDRALGALVIKAALERAGLQPDLVEEVVFSQQYRTGELPPNMARPISVDAGIPIRVPNFSVAKACGGSLKSVFLAAQAIKAGDAQVLVAGGLEHMTNAGYLLTKARWGYRLGHGQLMDQLVLFDLFTQRGPECFTSMLLRISFLDPGAHDLHPLISDLAIRTQAAPFGLLHQKGTFNQLLRHLSAKRRHLRLGRFEMVKTPARFTAQRHGVFLHGNDTVADGSQRLGFDRGGC